MHSRYQRKIYQIVHKYIKLFTNLQIYKWNIHQRKQWLVL
jgi:hypothetical protein